MLDLPPMVLAGLAIIIGLCLYAFSWWIARDLPTVVKVAVRVVTALVILVPFALLVVTNQMSQQSPVGGSIGGERSAERKPKVNKPRTAERKRRAKKSAKAAEARETNRTEEVADGTAPDREVASIEEEDVAAKFEEPEPPKASPDDDERARTGATRGLGGGAGAGSEGASGAGEGGGGTGSRGIGGLGESETDGAPANPPPVAAAEEKKDWDVVPVYYGTDRARQPNDDRIEYNANRARRIELGRALVTIPAVHQKPKIERPWKITIPYFNVTVYEEKEDPKKHFTLQELKSMSEDDLLKLVKERLAKSSTFKDHAFVFIHGYYTSFDLAVYRTAQIAYDLDFDGAPFVYSWPSGGNVASYTYDLNSAAQAEVYLKRFLKMVAERSGAKKLSIIAHSMGNQPLLRVLKDFSISSPPEIKIDQLILAAPDVDRDNFENIAESIKSIAGGITLYAADNDRALNVSESFHGGVPRAGDVPEDGPVIVDGVDTIDVSAVSMDSLGLRHSGYAENNKLLDDIGKLIMTGARPPAKRLPSLVEIATPKGPYWRFPAAP